MAKDHSDAHGALPVHRQLLIAITAATTIIGAIVLWIYSSVPASPAVAPNLRMPAPPADRFMPTPQQLSALTIRVVGLMPFRSETVTDGSIAIDEDLTTPVFSPFTGRVTSVFAKLGDHVGKGTPLVEVEATEFAQAQSDLISAKAQFDLAETNEQRQHELYDSQGAALKDWQQAQVELATAQANLAAVRNRLRILGKTDDEIDALARMGRGSAAMTPASPVVAPISGTVVQRKVGLGQYVQTGSSDPLFLIGDLSTVWLIANVREGDAPAIHIGDPVEVHVLAFPARVFQAKITYVAPSIDPATHRLAVRADVTNREGLLKPQMFANFSILTGKDVTAPGVPQSAIVYEGDAARVWVSTPDGGLSLRQIKTGRINGNMVEVLSGVTAGERIVVSGAVFIDRAAADQ